MIAQEQTKALAFENKYGEEFEAMMRDPKFELCEKCLEVAPNDFSRNILRKKLREGPLPLDSPWRVTLRQTFLEVKEYVTEEWKYPLILLLRNKRALKNILGLY